MAEFPAWRSAQALAQRAAWRIELDPAAADKIVVLVLNIFVNESDDAVRGNDHEGDQAGSRQSAD